MRKTEIKLYRYDELSDDAKEHALLKHNEKWPYHNWLGEAKDTIKAFENEFGVQIKDWSYDSDRYDYELEFGAIDDDVLALKGNRARAWFWNNHGRIILEPATHYFMHDRDGKIIRAVSAESRKFTSKVFFERVYDGTCPFTGVCFDCDALDPLAEFCFGVRWDDNLKKRVPSLRRKDLDDMNTVESILRDCVESLFQSLRNDMRYQESEEHFEEECDANGWEFYEDGELADPGDSEACDPEPVALSVTLRQLMDVTADGVLFRIKDPTDDEKVVFSTDYLTENKDVVDVISGIIDMAVAKMSVGMSEDPIAPSKNLPTVWIELTDAEDSDDA